MNKLKPIRRMVVVGILAASAFTATAVTTVVAGTGIASAASSCTAGSSPSWITGCVQSDRGSGSDTTFFLMQQISNLYNQAGLYGCKLNSDEATCQDNTAPYTAANNPDNPATTDYTDNYDRSEEVQGVDEVGSGAGQAQLCQNNQGSNNAALPPGFSIDYARSSSGISSSQAPSCIASEKEDFFAADAVALLDWSNINPSSFDAADGVANVAPYSSVNGGAIGAVAAGWLPGDSLTCNTSFTGTYGAHQNGVNDCSGYPFEDLDNGNFAYAAADANGPEPGGEGNLDGTPSGDGNAGAGSASLAHAIWCSGTINNWGQLTNIGPFTHGVPSHAVGSGTVVTGLPINLIGVNPSSGTTGVWTKFVASGDSGCTNPNGPQTVVGTDTHQALENNASQIDDFATTDYTPGAQGTNSITDQAVELATALYFVSYGVYKSNPWEKSVILTVGGARYNSLAAAHTTGAVLASFPGQLVSLNTQFPTTSNVLAQTFPTSRELGNIYLSTAYLGAGVRASTAGFLNWICDANSSFTKGVDLSNGKNYDAELTTLINNTYGFIRLDDANSSVCPMITSVVFPNS